MAIDTVQEIWSNFDFDFSRAPIFYPLNAITIEKGNFSSAKFYSNADFTGATFTKNAYFSRAIFTKNAYFSVTKFTQTANFSRAIFTQNVDFSRAIFTKNAYFSRATFKGIASFGDPTFEKYSPLFVTTDDELGETYRAQFAVLSDTQGEHEFTVREGSKLIELGKATLRGKPFIIPVGTVLFDWDDEIQGYITSEPAEPLDNSSAGEENITE